MTCNQKPGVKEALMVKDAKKLQLMIEEYNVLMTDTT